MEPRHCERDSRDSRQHCLVGIRRIVYCEDRTFVCRGEPYDPTRLERRRQPDPLVSPSRPVHALDWEHSGGVKGQADRVESGSIFSKRSPFRPTRSGTLGGVGDHREQSGGHRHELEATSSLTGRGLSVVNMFFGQKLTRRLPG